MEGALLGGGGRVPSSYYDRGDGLAGLIVPTTPGGFFGTLALTASRALYVRFVLSKPLTVTSLSFVVTTASTGDDACDVGIYDSALTRLVSAGATLGKLNSTGTKSVTIAGTALAAGVVYYAGFSCGTLTSATSILSINMGSGGFNVVDIFGAAAPNALVAGQSSAHPLPASTSGIFAIANSALLVLKP